MLERLSRTVDAKASRMDGLNVLFPVASLALLVGLLSPPSGATLAVGMPGLTAPSALPTA